MEVNEDLGFGADVPLSLLLREEGVAVNAAVDHVGFALHQSLQLFHVDLAHEFVFAISKVDKLVDGDSARYLLDERRVETIHVDRQANNVAELLPYKADAFVYKLCHAQEVGADENRDHVLQI